MKKTYVKFLRRSVWRTRARFISILAITAIGVGFLAGLLSTTPDMQLTVDRYYDQYNIYDINVKGPLGLTQGDLDAISALDGVESVTPGYVTDLILSDDAGSYVTRLYGMPQGENTVNGTRLISGRLPENPGECLISAPDLYTLQFEVGDHFQISTENKDYENLGDTYAFDKLTAVGIVETPLFFSSDSEPSTVGSGAVQLVVFMPPEAYNLDVYTDAFIRLSGAADLDSFSDRYAALADTLQLETETLGKERSILRHDEVVAKADKSLADAEQEYADGKKEADEELAKAKKKLDDGKKELEDNRKKLEDGKKELAQGKLDLADGEQQWSEGRDTLDSGWAEVEANRAKLSDAKSQLYDSQSQLDSKISQETDAFLAQLPDLTEKQIADLSAHIDAAEKEALAELDQKEAELTAGEQQLADGEKELAQKESELTDARSQLTAAWSAYEQNQIQLADSRAALTAAQADFTAAISQKRQDLEAVKDTLSPEEYQTALEKINGEEATGQEELDAKSAVLATQESALAAAKTELDTQEAALTQGEAALKAGKAKLAEEKQKLAEGRTQLEAGRKKLTQEISAKRKELENYREEITGQIKAAGLEKIKTARAQAQTQIDAGWDEVTSGEAALADAQEELSQGETDLEASAQTLADARRKIAESEQELQDGEKKLTDGEKELKDGEKEYTTEKAKAEKKLADARKEIDDAKADIADIPVPEWMVFTREDNLSFSAYKSDSSKVAAIAAIFPIFFFLVAALVALTTMTRLVEEERTQIGVFKALGYSNGKITFYYMGYSILASLLGSVIGILLGSYTLPAIIANAYAMNYSIPPLVVKFWWNYALIIVPVAILCTVVSTWAACMNQLRERPSSLMLPRAPQVGKRILLERISPLWKRFSFTQKITARNIFRYKKRLFMTVIGIAGCTALLVAGFGFRDSIQDVARKQFGEIYLYDASLSLRDDLSAAEEEKLTTIFEDKTSVQSYLQAQVQNGYIQSKKCSLLVPNPTQDLSAQIDLHNMGTGQNIPFDSRSAVITQKLSETLGLKVGDRAEVKNDGGLRGEVTITGIAENYVSDFLFLGADLYKELFSSPAAYNQVFMTLNNPDQAARDAFSQRVLASDGALLLLFNQDIEDTFHNMVKSIDYIVMVLIVSAGGLAFIVLYNLTNINICERTKELATIKVLGFRRTELAFYIYRETLILCIIGAAIGLFLGIFLHAFIVMTVEVDAVMFGRSIAPLSYVFSAALTMLFMLLVDLIMLKKLRKIDMVESMKAND